MSGTVRLLQHSSWDEVWTAETCVWMMLEYEQSIFRSEFDVYVENAHVSSTLESDLVDGQGDHGL